MNDMKASNVDLERNTQAISGLHDDLKSKSDRNKEEIIQLKRQGIGATNINDLKQLHDLAELQKDRDELEADVTNLQCRSMKNKLMFLGLKENNSENTEQLLRDFLYHELEIDQRIEFGNVHRFGRRNTGKSRLIVARFIYHMDLVMVKENTYKLRGTPFSVNEQFPAVIEDERKKLYPVMKHYRQAGHRVKLVRDKLFIDGQLHDPNNGRATKTTTGPEDRHRQARARIVLQHQSMSTLLPSQSRFLFVVERAVFVSLSAWYALLRMLECAKISLTSKNPAPQTTAAAKKGHSDPKTLPVPRPLSPQSGAAQNLPPPKPDSSGNEVAQRVVSGLRLRTTLYVAGDGTVWCGGLCVEGEDLACVGGLGSLRSVDMTGRVKRTVQVGGSKSWYGHIARGDDGELFVASEVDHNISRVSADGAVSTFSSLTFPPCGLTQLSSGRLLVCGGTEGLYTVTGRGVQVVELDVDVKCAADVSVNSKGDVAVADSDGEKVCILDGQYKHVGTYSPTKSGPIRPVSLTSDGENFVICDGNDRTIRT
ncbi:hypothetical protein ScPMuIL_008210 [Solemya velum]